MKKLVPLSKPERFTFEIYITEKCSYDCKYCHIHTPKIKFNKIDFNLLFSKNIDPSADVYIYGGEPLIHPELHEVIRRLEEIGHSNIIIQSNLSSSPARIEKVLEFKSVSINPSYHHEEADFMDFIQKVQLISDKDRLNHVAVMWIKEYDKHIYLLYKMLNSKFEGVHLEPTLPWTQDHVEWEDKNELIAFDSKYNASLTKDSKLY